MGTDLYNFVSTTRLVPVPRYQVAVYIYIYIYMTIFNTHDQNAMQ